MAMRLKAIHIDFEWVEIGEDGAETPGHPDQYHISGGVRVDEFESGQYFPGNRFGYSLDAHGAKAWAGGRDQEPPDAAPLTPEQQIEQAMAAEGKGDDPKPS